MSEIYESDFRPKIIQEGLCMARRKVKITDFIQTCETNSRLQYLADSFVPSCSLYDVIDGNYVPPQKEKTRKKSSSRRMADADTMFIAYRFRGYPTEEQESYLKQNIGAARFMWNRMLSDYELMWRELWKTIPMTPADYKGTSGLEWLSDVDSYALLNVQLNLEKARSDYFSGDKGKPRYKKKHCCRDTYTTNYCKNNIRFEGDGIRLPKIADPIRLSMHIPVRPGGQLKNVTVIHEPDGKWYFSIVLEYPAEEAEPSFGLQQFFKAGDRDAVSAIGLDMSVPFLYVDNTGKKPSYEINGNEIRFMKQYRKLESRIAKEQRRLSHMVKDSCNYAKQCQKIARLHAKAKHRRDDFLHQIAVRLVRKYDLIAIEDLDMAAMKKGLKLGKSVSDVGWGKFTQILEELCNKFGKLLIRVGRWYPSSKTCSHCGSIDKDLKLNDRVYECRECGHTMNRDKNAAVNILEEAFRILEENMFRPSVEGYKKPALISTIA